MLKNSFCLYLSSARHHSLSVTLFFFIQHSYLPSCPIKPRKPQTIKLTAKCSNVLWSRPWFYTPGCVEALVLRWRNIVYTLILQFFFILSTQQRWRLPQPWYSFIFLTFIVYIYLVVFLLLMPLPRIFSLIPGGGVWGDNLRLFLE